jgi:hypothetical protein
VWCIRRGIGGGSRGDGAVLYLPDLCLRPVLSVDRGGELALDGFATFHVVNPYDDGIGPDEYVDWLIEAGYSIVRVPSYDSWLPRFEARHACIA